ncbi:MAG: hypothetical protein KDK36_13760 [Leptospiraceae bacterium]|nr:hypothetical protein [Leptospiraceae bacterium]
MEIEFSKEQYNSLIKAVSIANWISSSIDDEEFANSINELQNLEQYIFSQNEKFEANDKIYMEPELKEYYPTNELEEDIAPMLDNYDDFVFWEELTHRLARRDFVDEYGEEKVSNMDPLNRMELEEEFLVKYSEEFSTNGIGRLTIQKK